MDEARRVLERLARISDLEREQASPAQVLDELRELVREAELWLREEPEPGGAVEALARCRAALAADEHEEVMLLAH
jgi:regulator of sirC expression with transglutaminase-like and TPR domain